MNESPGLGIDFGRVINDASSHPSGSDTAFLKGDDDQVLATPEMEGAFDAIARLLPLFGGRVWIVSKAGPSIQAKTERWLRHHLFTSKTGVAMDHVRFVRRREDKAAVCKDLGITHFVDDRDEVLQYLKGQVPHLYLFGPQTRSSNVDATPAPTWLVAERLITASLQAD